MKITRIAQQQKRRNRYSVYVDHRYAFSLSETALLDEGLHAGQPIDAAQLKHYERLSATDISFSQALAYLARRRRSQWETEQYLLRKGLNAEQLEDMLQRLRRTGLVDDRAFARAWIDNRRLLKPVSRRRLTQELRQKRVAEDIIARAMSTDPADDAQTLVQLIARKRRQSKYQDSLKLKQYLARQGYSYGDIQTALAFDGDSSPDAE